MSVNIPPICVLIEICNGEQILVNNGFNCDNLQTAIYALREAALLLEGLDDLQHGLVRSLDEIRKRIGHKSANTEAVTP